ncbi:chemosensory receptor B [Elysia marginata]|uniref:Chemosensory receptor B n=1 Tax=Elysia marginata TaxID=1093978 RepID=A0AAV4JNT9_9GAST|nr:chemosensory receptor B [Elysia marginata]
MYPDNGSFNASCATETVQGAVSSDLINGELYWWVMSIILGLDILVAIIATGANIVTILIYYKLGYNDTTSISLTALAISDLGVAITTFICVLAFLLPLMPNSPFTYGMFYTSGSAPHTLFSRVSALITTYLSVERCVCVSIPLKVKSIFTPRRTVIAMVSIFVTLFGMYPLVILRFPVGWITFPHLNETVLGILPVTDYPTIVRYNIQANIVSVWIPFFTFPTMIVTTILLALALKKSKKWRDANKSMPLNLSTNKTAAKRDDGNDSSVSESTKATSKEARAVKMVIIITTVFILSIIPSCMHIVAQISFPDFRPGGRYSKLYVLTNMMFLIVDSVNCSANVIIYYNMSSRFRLAAQGLFRREAK